MDSKRFFTLPYPVSNFPVLAKLNEHRLLIQEQENKRIFWSSSTDVFIEKGFEIIVFETDIQEDHIPLYKFYLGIKDEPQDLIFVSVIPFESEIHIQKAYEENVDFIFDGRYGHPKGYIEIYRIIEGLFLDGDYCTENDEAYLKILYEKEGEPT